jgi:hypothetical protein
MKQFQYFRGPSRNLNPWLERWPTQWPSSASRRSRQSNKHGKGHSRLGHLVPDKKFSKFAFKDHPKSEVISYPQISIPSKIDGRPTGQHGSDSSPRTIDGRSTSIRYHVSRRESEVATVRSALNQRRVMYIASPRTGNWSQ